MAAAISITAVVPAFNEEVALPGTLRRLRAIPEIHQIIVADGGSTDRTCAIAREFGCELVHGERGRGRQLRRGAALATGDVVAFIHADTWLPSDAGAAILIALQRPGVVAGAFWKVFRDPHWLMRGSRLKCAIRFYLFQRFMADQAIFIRRHVLEEIGGVPDVPLMEEFELCRLLKRKGRLALADATVKTSARRFHERGVLRTYWRMFWVTTRYFMGTSPEELMRIYEKKTKRRS